MGKSDAFESDILALIFQNANAALIGDATGLRGSTAAGSLYGILFTADPGEAGNQTTNEASYPGYARIAIVRSAVGFTLSGTAPTIISNAAALLFPICTSGGPQTITHIGIGTALSGSGKLLYSGALSSNLIVNPNIAPNFAIGAFSIQED